jgi:tetratricopeptide (TPR) repeat protein
MAKKKVKSPQALENVEQTLTRTEKYLEENYRTLLNWLAVVVGIVALIWLGRLFLNKRNSDAHSQMYQAERYFEVDSMSLALNGDGNYLGFIDIISSYRMTRAANLARYYSGIAWLKLGEYETAIENLEKFRKRDKVLSAIATGAMGDAWVELGDMEKGANYYMEAAGFSINEFFTPLFLMKAAQVYESEGSLEKALDIYQRIRDEFPLSTEGAAAEKHIARVRAQVN